MTPDFIPLVPGLVIAGLATLAYLFWEPAPDPKPDLSRLDRLDGLHD